MTITRTALGVAAGALTITVLLLVSGGVAAAGDPPTPPATGSAPDQGPITLSAEESEQLCTVRIPSLLARIDRFSTRIGADAGTVGSTEWLQDRAEQARTSGHDELADRLDGRIGHRPEVTARLADAQQRIEAFRAEHCA